MFDDYVSLFLRFVTSSNLQIHDVSHNPKWLMGFLIMAITANVNPKCNMHCICIRNRSDVQPLACFLLVFIVGMEFLSIMSEACALHSKLCILSQVII